MAVASSNYTLQVGVQVNTSSLKNQLDSFGKNYTLKINAQITGANQTSRLNTNIKDMSNNTANLSSNMRRASSSATEFTSKASGGYNKLDKSVKQVIGSQQSLSKVLYDQVRTRMVTIAINEMIQVMQLAVQTIKEFDDAVTEFKKVSDLSGDSLDEYTRKLGELGETVARTRKLFLCENV